MRTAATKRAAPDLETVIAGARDGWAEKPELRLDDLINPADLELCGWSVNLGVEESVRQ